MRESESKSIDISSTPMAAAKRFDLSLKLKVIKAVGAKIIANNIKECILISKNCVHFMIAIFKAANERGKQRSNSFFTLSLLKLALGIIKQERIIAKGYSKTRLKSKGERIALNIPPKAPPTEMNK